MEGRPTTAPNSNGTLRQSGWLGTVVIALKSIIGG